MGTGAKGTISNPYTMAEFEELADAGLWQGGYVEDDSGNVAYMMAELTVTGYSGYSGDGSDGSDYDPWGSDPWGSDPWGSDYDGSDPWDDDNDDDYYDDDDYYGSHGHGPSGGPSGETDGGGGGHHSSGDANDYNNCYFNTLAKVAEKYGLNVTGKTFHDNYFNPNFWEHSGTEYERVNGPYTEKKLSNGEIIPNPDAHEFINIYFNTIDNGWQEDTKKIERYCNKNKGDNKGYVIGVIDVDRDDQDHVVILKRAEGNYFEYYDPTTKEDNKEIRIDKIKYATKVIGIKIK